MIYRLMIKTHDITKLKYLCITKRSKWKEYTGSGVKWLRHIKKHGNHISTELLFESKDYSKFAEQCLFYSKLFDVALSKDFANQIPEVGYDNKYGVCNFEIWWNNASKDIKAAVVAKRAIKMKDNHWIHKVDTRQIRNAISEAQNKYWDKISYEEKLNYTAGARLSAKKFHEDTHRPEYLEYIRKQSETMKAVYKRTSPEVVSQRNRNQRLNTSMESKQSRILKIREKYKKDESGKYAVMFAKMSTDRIGANNPGAKITVWKNIRYSQKDFKKFMSDNNITKEYTQCVLDNNIFADCYNEFRQLQTKEL